jgi:hypothetical protein
MTENPVPTDTRGRRLKEHVRQLNLRTGIPYIEQLDELCRVNKRSRREIVEILISEAFAELEENPHARISPL